MVNKAVVLETIKKMYDSGIEDSVVRQTLLDIGLSAGEIREYMAEAKGEAALSEERPAVAEARPAVVGRERVSERLAEERTTQEALHTTTHAAIEGHDARLEAIGKEIGSMEKRIGRIGALTEKPSNQELVEMLAAANQRLATLEKQVSDLKALTKALKAVMEKILETDRKILGKL